MFPQGNPDAYDEREMLAEAIEYWLDGAAVTDRGFSVFDQTGELVYERRGRRYNVTIRRSE